MNELTAHSDDRAEAIVAKILELSESGERVWVHTSGWNAACDIAENLRASYHMDEPGTVSYNQNLFIWVNGTSIPIPVTDHGASPVASIPRLLRSLGKRRQPSSQNVQA